MQKSNEENAKPLCWQASSQWEKAGLCNLRVKLIWSYHEIMFLSNEKTDLMLELFAEQVMFELQCTESLVWASKNTNCCVLVQKSKWRECKPTYAEKLLSQWEKVGLCNFKSKAWVHERCFFLMKWNVICNAEDRF